MRHLPHQTKIAARFDCVIADYASITGLELFFIFKFGILIWVAKLVSRWGHWFSCTLGRWASSPIRFDCCENPQMTLTFLPLAEQYQQQHQLQQHLEQLQRQEELQHLHHQNFYRGKSQRVVALSNQGYEQASNNGRYAGLSSYDVQLGSRTRLYWTWFRSNGHGSIVFVKLHLTTFCKTLQTVILSIFILFENDFVAPNTSMTRRMIPYFPLLLFLQ